MDGNGFAQHNPNDGLPGNTPARPPGSGSNWQAGTASRHEGEGDVHDGDTSHLANVHAAGSSPCPDDLASFKEIRTMGK